MTKLHIKNIHFIIGDVVASRLEFNNHRNKKMEIYIGERFKKMYAEFVLNDLKETEER